MKCERGSSCVNVNLSVHLCSRVLQSMAAGTSGASGPCAAASARGSAVEGATLQHPDTEARRAKGTARPPRTARTDSVPRVRPLSLLGIVIIVFPSLSSSHTLTVTSSRACLTRRLAQSLTVRFDTDALHDNVSALPPVCCSLDILCVKPNPSPGVQTFAPE